MRELVLVLLLLLPAGGVRLPKWLYNPLQLTNIPLVPALDLGRPCFSGGEEGVCSLRGECRATRTVAGPCTLFKSVCCMETLTCNNNISLAVGRFTNPAHPDRQVDKVLMPVLTLPLDCYQDQALGTCSLSVNIRPGTCQLR